MACFKPLKAYQKTYWRLDATPLEHEREKILHFKKPSNMDGWKELEIPCGHCLGCRLDKSNEWAVRASLELKNNEKNCFVTLTYAQAPLNDKNHMTLSKYDLQCFIKRLRKNTGKKIKYIACGEYGPKTHRPHYHLILFGYWPDDAKMAGISKTQIEFYESKELSKTWANGWVTIEKANYNSIAYVARYTQKKAGLKPEKRKYTGEIEAITKIDERYGEIYSKYRRKYVIEKYDVYGREKEFILASKNPSIGLEFFKKHENEILKNGGIFLKINDKTVFKQIPKYFLKKIDEDKKAYYTYEKEKIILANRKELSKRIRINKDETINEENAIKKHREYLKKNLEERAKYLKRGAC